MYTHEKYKSIARQMVDNLSQNGWNQFLQKPAVVRDALQTVVEAQGGVSKVAKQIDMDPQLLSKVLSNENTPLIDALGIVLKALGYQLSIKPLESENASLETDTIQTAHIAEGPTSLQ